VFAHVFLTRINGVIDTLPDPFPALFRPYVAWCWRAATDPDTAAVEMLSE
jgi:hypothetical protein